uniref:E3 ubiquitin-protein ligase DCST1 n=1 Tax=Haemonchus contortus TaxID=6289 RepID=A0A7I4YW52_HAECO
MLVEMIRQLHIEEEQGSQAFQRFHVLPVREQSSVRTAEPPSGSRPCSRSQPRRLSSQEERMFERTPLEEESVVTRRWYRRSENPERLARRQEYEDRIHALLLECKQRMQREQQCREEYAWYRQQEEKRRRRTPSPPRRQHCEARSPSYSDRIPSAHTIGSVALANIRQGIVDTATYCVVVAAVRVVANFTRTRMYGPRRNHTSHVGRNIANALLVHLVRPLVNASVRLVHLHRRLADDPHDSVIPQYLNHHMHAGTFHRLAGYVSSCHVLLL